MDASDYTEHQKKLIQILYPDKYTELWGRVPKKKKKKIQKKKKEVETKKEEEPAAE
tara:strand:+ start:2700 stop:2867 length:168 start_codon:yes stop_codon:yes gene_type:complete